MKNLQENLEILRKIDKKKDITQRELAKDMGLSLGKLNYCLNGLKKKGLIKINNFKKNKKKLDMFICSHKRCCYENNDNHKFYRKKNERV